MNIAINISKQLSSKLANMSFVCACLVVSIHIRHPTLGCVAVLDKALAGGISRIAVPSFFCISGFLLAGKMEGNWWFREVKKRFKSLLLPFWIWGIICFLSTFPLAVLCDVHSGVPFGTTFVQNKEWSTIILDWSGLDFTKMPLAGHLWFLRNLFILVLVSPVINNLVNKFKWWWIIGTFSLFCMWRFVEYMLPSDVNGFLWYGFSLEGLVAFSLGILLRRQEYHLENIYISYLALALGIIFWISSFCFQSVSGLLISLMIPCLAYAVWYWMPSNPFPRIFINSSFFIYLCHTIFIGYLQSFPNIIPVTDTLFGFILHWLAPITLSILTAVFLHRVSPRFYSFLIGGRRLGVILIFINLSNYAIF